MSNIFAKGKESLSKAQGLFTRAKPDSDLVSSSIPNPAANTAPVPTEPEIEKPLRIGSKAPQFKAASTSYRPDLYGLAESEVDFHEYIKKRWAVLFSHPCDFTPVCTTEIVAFAKKQVEFDKRDTRLIGLSVGEIGDHIEWVGDIHSNILNDTPFRINFPIVADKHGDIAREYDMLDKEKTPTNEDVTACKQTLHTIRSVFIINPQKEIRAILTYPMETGRNIDEIIRMIDSLQARADHGHRIVTPADWQPGNPVLFRQDNPKRRDGRRSDIEERHGLPYMQYRPLPKGQLRGFREDNLQPRYPELHQTPIEPKPNPLVGPSTSGTSDSSAQNGSADPETTSDLYSGK